MLGCRTHLSPPQPSPEASGWGIEAFGAEVTVERIENGRITLDLIARMKARAYAPAEEPSDFYADPLGSPDVCRSYEPLGQEIAEYLDGEVDVLIATAGTGTALMGAADGLIAAGVTPKSAILRSAAATGPSISGPHLWQVARKVIRQLRPTGCLS
ncbi:pyridoxal-phosphate dependent enzyme [Rubellimicrobium mesophilum]|uniref:pyridoxal-phosphate dependent enzyme n=1 Tax=Rubellimicrobium mesophilum TaxID=1123067 RepID=UPI0009E854DB